MQRLMTAFSLLAVAAPSPGASGALAARAGSPLPHIWVVVVDDLGWSGTSLSGFNHEVQTPTLKALAAQGVTLTAHYAYKFCSPSRASFLTGRVPGHGIQEINPGMTSPVATNGNLTMIGAKLQQAGYYTVQIGKWHQVSEQAGGGCCGWRWGRRVSYSPASERRRNRLPPTASPPPPVAMRGPGLLHSFLHAARARLQRELRLPGRRRGSFEPMLRLRERHPAA
jgi:arylsulfatase A-like enzyme